MAYKQGVNINRKDMSTILRCALDIKGMSSAQLARQIDVTAAAVRAYVNGSAGPSVEVWEKICRVLEIPPTWNRVCDSEDYESTHEKNRQLFISIEMMKQQERRKNWIKLFLALGYREEDIRSYVDDFVDWHADEKFDDASNEWLIEKIMADA